MRLLNFNEKKKSVVCEEERKTSKLNSFFMGLYFPPYSLNSGWEKKISINYWNNHIYFSKVKFWIYRGDGMGRDGKHRLE